MLNIMTLAYQGIALKDLEPLESVEARRQHLFDQYLERAFERRPLGGDTGYNQETALMWLTNLAQGMVQYGQSIFHIERLQPVWLPAGQYRRYKSLVGFYGGLLSGLIVALILGLVITLTGQPLYGLFAALIMGPFFGLIFGLGGYLGNRISATWGNRWLRFAASVIAVGLVFGLITILPGGFVSMLFGMGSGGTVVSLSAGLFVGGVSGVLLGLFFGLSNGLIAYQTEIASVETLSFSWSSGRNLLKRIGQGFIVVLLVVFLVVLVVVPIGTLIEGRSLVLVDVLKVALIFGLSFGLISGLIWGLMTLVQTRPAEQVLRPNQGMHGSFKNAIRMCLYTSVVVGLPALLLLVLSTVQRDLFGPYLWVGSILLLFLGLALPATFFYFGGPLCCIM